MYSLVQVCWWDGFKSERLLTFRDSLALTLLHAPSSSQVCARCVSPSCTCTELFVCYSQAWNGLASE